MKQKRLSRRRKDILIRHIFDKNSEDVKEVEIEEAMDALYHFLKKL